MHPYLHFFNAFTSFPIWVVRAFLIFILCQTVEERVCSILLSCESCTLSSLPLVAWCYIASNFIVLCGGVAKCVRLLLMVLSSGCEVRWRDRSINLMRVWGTEDVGTREDVGNKYQQLLVFVQEQFMECSGLLKCSWATARTHSSRYSMHQKPSKKTGEGHGEYSWHPCSVRVLLRILSVVLQHCLHWTGVKWIFWFELWIH